MASASIVKCLEISVLSTENKLLRGLRNNCGGLWRLQKPDLKITLRRTRHERVEESEQLGCVCP